MVGVGSNSKFWLHLIEPLFLLDVLFTKLNFFSNLVYILLDLRFNYFVLIVLQVEHSFQLVLLVRPLVLCLLVVYLLEIH